MVETNTNSLASRASIFTVSTSPRPLLWRRQVIEVLGGGKWAGQLLRAGTAGYRWAREGRWVLVHHTREPDTPQAGWDVAAAARSPFSRVTSSGVQGKCEGGLWASRGFLGVLVTKRRRRMLSIVRFIGVIFWTGGGGAEFGRYVFLKRRLCLAAESSGFRQVLFDFYFALFQIRLNRYIS